jgi:hypothetical protein
MFYTLFLCHFFKHRIKKEIQEQIDHSQDNIKITRTRFTSTVLSYATFRCHCYNRWHSDKTQRKLKKFMAN